MNKIIPPDAVLIPDQAKRVFKGEIYDVYQWPQTMFDGTTATFEMLRRPDTAQAICIVDDNILVVNDKQPHHGARLSFPGGRVDADETTQQAAKREIREETGYEFEHWRLISVSQPQTKIEWFIYTYLAWGVTNTAKPNLDNGEIIVVKHLPLEDVKKLIAQKADYLGEAQELFSNITDMKSLLSLREYSGRTAEF